MKIRMVPHDPAWRRAFEREAARLRDVPGEVVVDVHHMGSTAIPGIHAKPVIDLLLVVRDLVALDAKQPAMEALGYEALGEFGIPGRRFFRRDDARGDRTHHIHAFEDGSESGSAQIARHLAFRNYLIAHPETAQEYSNLKRELAARHPNDSGAYMDGKDGFIQEIDRRAAAAS